MSSSASSSGGINTNLGQIMSIYVDGLTTFTGHSFELIHHVLNKIILPSVGVKYRLNEVTSDAHEFALSAVKAYTLILKFTWAPFLLHLAFFHLLNDRMRFGSGVFIIHALMLHTILMIITRHRRKLTNNTDTTLEEPKSVAHKLVDPISDLTRTYLTSAVLYLVLYKALVMRQLAIIRFAGHLLWLSYFVGIDNANATGTYDRRVDHYHSHWIWYFGLSTIPALTLTIAQLRCICFTLLTPLVLCSANFGLPKRFVPRELRMIATCEENMKRATGAAFDRTSVDAISVDPLEDVCSKFRWSAWAVDSVNWMLANLSTSRRKVSSRS